MSFLKEHIKSLIPERIFMSQLVLRRASIWKKSGAIFVHIPKNGGTSINAAIYGRFMGHYSVHDIERVRPQLLKSLPSLAVSRNPWARAYSAFTFARKGKAMKDGVQIRHSKRYKQPCFDCFERFVLEWLPSRNLLLEDYVFRPQTYFLLDQYGSIGVEKLGKIEDPQSYLPWLEHTLDKKIDVKYLNRTTKPFSYRSVYTKEMRDVLAQCYSCDLERLYYEF